MVIKALFVMLFSWLAALLVNFVTAIIVTAAGRSLSWFTHTSLLLPLYVVPAALALAEVHSFWLKIVSVSLNFSPCVFSSITFSLL